jgi:hypothetical protein
MGDRPMNSGIVPRVVFVLSICLAVISICDRTIAQRASLPFKPGDSVEVKEGFEWKKATVVRVNRSTGWVEARLEEKDLPRGIPESMRKQLSTSSFPPDQVRMAQAPISAKATQVHSLRTWTDRSGKFSVQARFQRLEGTAVVLTKEDGKSLQVPLEKLSEQDVGYIRGVTETSESPFQEVATPASVELKKANWQSVKTIRPQTFSKWSFSPSIVEGQSDANASKVPEMQLQLAELPDSQAFFEKVVGLHVSDDGRRAYVCRAQGSVHQDGSQYIEVIDVDGKNSTGIVALPPKTALLDALPDQGLVMYRPEERGFGDKTVLTIARLDKQSTSPLMQWEPYAHEDWGPRRDIENARFLNEEKILTINNHGSAITIWDVASATAVANIPVARTINLKTALSLDRKLLAVIMKDGVAIIDLSAGRHVATIPANGVSYQEIAFRDDNRRLAGVSDRGLAIWDLTTGELVRDVCHSVISGHGTIAWTGEFVLVNGRYLFDVDRRILLWEYQQSGMGRSESTAHRRNRVGIVSKNIQDQTSTPILTTIPHSGALEEAKRLPAPEELLVVKPGDAVAIEVDVDPGIAAPEEIQSWFNGQAPQDTSLGSERGNIVVINGGGEEKELIRRSLATALKAAGLNVVDKSDLVVKAVCKQQPSQTVEINADGRWPVRREDIVQRTITPHASYLEMSLRGDILWKRGYIARPGHIFFIERGETLDAALTRLTRPNLSVFRNAKFSAHIARPGSATENRAYGVSRLTSRGLIDGSASDRGGASF